LLEPVNGGKWLLLEPRLPAAILLKLMFSEVAFPAFKVKGKREIELPCIKPAITVVF